MTEMNPMPIPGVNWDVRSKAWRARIMRDYRQVELGLFKDRDDAIAARLAAEKESPSKVNRTPWSEYELSVLHDMRLGGYTYLQIGNKIGRSAEVCRSRYNSGKRQYPARRWTPAELQMLRRNRHKKTADELGGMLKRSVMSINNKLTSMDLSARGTSLPRIVHRGCAFPLALVPRVKTCGKITSGRYCETHAVLMELVDA